MRVTMEIVSKTLFDVEVDEEVQEIEHSFDAIISEIVGILIIRKIANIKV